MKKTKLLVCGGLVCLALSSFAAAKKIDWNKIPEHSSVADSFIKVEKIKAAWEAERAAVSLISGQDMLEEPKGVFGSKNAKLNIKNDTRRHWFGILPKHAWVLFDLGKEISLDEIRIWNYQQNRGCKITQRGMKDVTIEYTNDPSKKKWTLLKKVELKEGDDKKAFSASDIIKCNGIKARFVKITATSNWSKGTNKIAGLGQVRFYADK